MNKKFTIASIKVYYNTVTKTVLLGKPVAKNKNIVCFPSMGEYSLFRQVRDRLENTYYEIIIHPRISRGGISWVIDLGIRTVDVRCQERLAELINVCNGCKARRCSEIYLEYKGVQDKNFLYKLRNLQRNSETTYNSIVLIGKNNDVVNTAKGVKPILSLEKFLRVLDITLVNCGTLE